jgi:hypothetical protein
MNRNSCIFVLARSVELQAVSTVVGAFDDRMIGLYMRCKDFAALHMASQRANEGLARENSTLRTHVKKLEDMHAHFMLIRGKDEREDGHGDAFGTAPPLPFPERSGELCGDEE